eukprot:11057689-Lingulodinium_polyedra.AAC.1
MAAPLAATARRALLSNWTGRARRNEWWNRETCREPLVAQERTEAPKPVTRSNWQGRTTPPRTN